MHKEGVILDGFFLFLIIFCQFSKIYLILIKLLILNLILCDLFHRSMRSSLDKYFRFFRWLDKKNSE